MRRPLPLVLLLLVGCSNVLDVEPDAAVTLAPGETVAVTGGDIQVTFVEVRQDSRCPDDPVIVCLWAGDAEVALAADGQNGPATLLLHTHEDFETSALYATWQVDVLGLVPPPTADGPPSPADYRLTIRIRSALSP